MPVLKSTESGRVIGDAVVLDLGDLRRQATEIVAGARQRGDAIIEQARNDAQEIVRTASARGYQAGFEAGLKTGTEKGEQSGHEQVIAELRPRLEQLTSTWTDAIAQWERDRQSMLLDARDDVLRFAFAVAQRVTRRVIASHPDVVVDQVRDALEIVCDRSGARVVVHPDDRALVEEVLAEAAAAAGASAHIELGTDDAMARGGCCVRTRGGEIDAGIETQLEQIAKALFDSADVES